MMMLWIFSTIFFLIGVTILVLTAKSYRDAKKQYELNCELLDALERGLDRK